MYLNLHDGLFFFKKNTIDSCNHYDTIFMAHNGPVYGIKFSPFCSSIFITYGADWKIKIWIENMESPLLSLSYSVSLSYASTLKYVKRVIDLEMCNFFLIRSNGY